MLTLKQMILATPMAIKGRAKQQCFGQVFALPKKAKGVTRSGGYIVEDESGKYREFKFRVKCTDGWRKVGIRFYGPLNINTHCWCWCSCPYFKYNCEVALTARGSSSIVQSNGQRPRFTNPKMQPRVCKHVFLAFALAMRRRKPVSTSDGMATLQSKKSVKTRLNVTQATWRGDRPVGRKPESG